MDIKILGIVGLLIIGINSVLYMNPRFQTRRGGFYVVAVTVPFCVAWKLLEARWIVTGDLVMALGVAFGITMMFRWRRLMSEVRKNEGNRTLRSK